MIEFLRLMKWELFRLFARRRTYIGFGVFLVVEIIFLFLWTTQSRESEMEKFINRVAGGFDVYFSGLTLAFLMVVYTMFILGLVFVALVAGDILAKDTEDGNLRLILARPVTRLRLLVVKFLSCQIYTTALFLFVGVSAFAMGVIDRGWGGGFMAWAPPYILEPALFDWNEGMFRYFGAIFTFSLIYLPVTGIAFMLGCFKIKPAAATIVTVAIFIGDSVLSVIPLPAFEPYREFFLTTRMKAWLLLLEEDISWFQFTEQSIWLIGIGFTGFVIGWAAFERRDIKS